jgi:transcriptional pleiotropic regulator of transition state genes
MKATGIVRKVDELGRICLPKELRGTLSIVEGDPVEIFVDAEGEVILKKYQPGCVLCGGMGNLRRHPKSGKLVCSGCLNELMGGEVNERA